MANPKRQAAQQTTRGGKKTTTAAQKPSRAGSKAKGKGRGKKAGITIRGRVAESSKDR